MTKVWKNKKGFTLIELIVVIAILAVLAAIAIPKFANMRTESAVKADASTAEQLANACRVQETQTGQAVTTLANLQPQYMVVPKAQTSGTDGTTFALEDDDSSDSNDIEGGGGINSYIVSFTPSSDYELYSTKQYVVEHQKFDITKATADDDDEEEEEEEEE